MRSMLGRIGRIALVLAGLGCKDAVAPTNPLVGIYDLDSVSGGSLPVRDTSLHANAVFLRRARIVIFETNFAVIAIGDSLINSGSGITANYTSYYPVTIHASGKTAVISYGNIVGLPTDTAVVTEDFKLGMTPKSVVSPLKFAALVFVRTSSNVPICRSESFGECIGSL